MKMKSCLLASVAAIAMMGSASAADLVVKAPPPVYLPTWTGFCAGVAVGHSQVSSEANLHQIWDYEGYVRPYADPMGSYGLAGTLYAGWNGQAGNVVYGLEADFSHLRAQSTSYFNHVDSYYDGALHQKVNWLATFRGRLGYAIDNVMLYATAGAAWARIDQGYTVKEKDIRFVRDESKFGYVVGAGVEYMVGRHLMLRAEGLYHNFKGYDAHESGTYTVDDPSVRAKFGTTEIFLARLGAALKF
jgi:outer membrane immunogenic protein